MHKAVIVAIAISMTSCEADEERAFATSNVLSVQSCEFRTRSAYRTLTFSNGSNWHYTEVRCGGNQNWSVIVRHSDLDRFQLLIEGNQANLIYYNYCRISTDSLFASRVPDFQSLEESGLSATVSPSNSEYCNAWLERYCAGPNHTTNWGRTACENRQPRDDYSPAWR